MSGATTRVRVRSVDDRSGRAAPRVPRYIRKMSEIELLAYLMDDAFDGRGIEQSDESQSLLGNLATVTPEQWHAGDDRWRWQQTLGID